MWALNINALWDLKWDFYFKKHWEVAYKDVWAIRTWVATIDDTEIVKIKSDNRDTIKAFVNRKFLISLTALEWFDPVKMQDLFNWTYTITTATPVVITNEAHGTGWTVWVPFKLTNKNWANTQVTITSIKAGASTLVDNTDYDVYVWDGTNGDLGYTYIVPLTAQTLAITANYTYTPKASEKVKFVWWTNELWYFDIKILAVKDWKYRTIIIENVLLNSSYALWYTDVTQSQDVTWVELSFEWDDSSSTFEFENELV